MRAGFGGPYALDWTPVIAACQAEGIAIDVTTLRKIREFETALLASMAKETRGKP